VTVSAANFVVSFRFATAFLALKLGHFHHLLFQG
jgi:hypothetical protein